MKEETLLAHDYYVFINRVKKTLGIDLSLYKEAQMKRRLTSLRNNRGYVNFATYFKALQENEKLLNEFIDRITINVTEFYRNPKRWGVLQHKVLPLLITNKQKLSIWSAACSTGEEPYSIALMMQEYFPHIRVEILATDIDESALNLAKQGVYKQKSLEYLPKLLKEKYFTKKEQLYILDPLIKRKVVFKKHDLLVDPYPKQVDVIVCRNVLIYFTDMAKDMIYKHLSQSLTDHGVLFVGSTEQIFNPSQYQLHVLETFFYQKREEG